MAARALSAAAWYTPLRASHDTINQARSRLSLIGPLAVWVRRAAASHLREPHIDPTFERQVALNWESESSRERNMEIMEQLSWHTMRVGDTTQYAIATQQQAQDDISLALATHTYCFPSGYELVFGLLRPGATVLDLGGHIGTFSLAAAALGCQVLTVEASPTNARLLQASVARNGFSNMRVVHAAVSDHSGSLRFIDAGPYGHVSRESDPDLVVEVPAATADALLTEAGWDHVDLIKLDVEGLEVAAVNGLARLLSRADAPLILYESNGHTLNLFGLTPGDLRSALASFGYAHYLVDAGCLVPVQPDSLQAECTVDFLAAKRLPESLAGRVAPASYTHTQVVQRIVATSAHPHWHPRAYIARALANAGPALLRDPRVIKVLLDLQQDAQPEVRAAAAWFRPAPNDRTRVSRPAPSAIGAESSALTPTEQMRRIREAVLNAESESPQEARMMLVKYFNNLAEMRKRLADLESHKVVKEQLFVSHAPVVGGLIVKFRSLWNWMSTKWYLQPILQQQNNYNVSSARAVRELTAEVELLALSVQELQARIETLEQPTPR